MYVYVFCVCVGICLRVRAYNLDTCFWSNLQNRRHNSLPLFINLSLSLLLRLFLISHSLIYQSELIQIVFTEVLTTKQAADRAHYYTNFICARVISHSVIYDSTSFARWLAG